MQLINGDLFEIGEDKETCSYCGEETDELYGCRKDQYCKNCLRQLATLEIANEMGERYSEEVTINGFLANAFSEEEINEILLRELKNASAETQKKSAENYCIGDKCAKWDFADWLEDVWFER